MMSQSLVNQTQSDHKSSSPFLSSHQQDISNNHNQKPLWESHHQVQTNQQPINNVQEQHHSSFNKNHNNNQTNNHKDKNQDGRNKMKVFGAKQQFPAYIAIVNDGGEEKLEIKGGIKAGHQAKLIQKINQQNKNSQFIITNNQFGQPINQETNNLLNTHSSLQTQNSSLTSQKKRIIGSRKSVSPQFTVIQPNSIESKEVPISRQSTKIPVVVQPETVLSNPNKEQSVEKQGQIRNNKSRPKVIGKQSKVSALFDTIEDQGETPQIISKVHNDKKMRISKSHFQQQRKQEVFGEKEQNNENKNENKNENINEIVSEQKQMAKQQTKQKQNNTNTIKISNECGQQKLQRVENQEVNGNGNEIVNNNMSNMTVESNEQSMHRKQKSRPKVYGSQIKVPARFDQIYSTQSKNQSSLYPNNNKSQNINSTLSNPKPMLQSKQQQPIVNQTKLASNGSQKQIRTFRSSKKLTAKIDIIQNKSIPKILPEKQITQHLQGSQLVQKLEHQQKEDDRKRKAASADKSVARKMFGSKAVLSAYMVNLGGGEDEGERTNVAKKVTLLMKSGKKLTAKIDQIQQDIQNDKCEFILEDKMSQNIIQQHNSEIQSEQKPNQKLQQQQQIQKHKQQNQNTQHPALQTSQQQSETPKQTQQQESIKYPQQDQDQIVQEQTEKQPSIKIIQSEQANIENGSEKHLSNGKSVKVIGSKNNINAYVQQISPDELDKDKQVKGGEGKVELEKSQKNNEEYPQQVFEEKEQNEVNVESKLHKTSDEAQQDGQDHKQQMMQSEQKQDGNQKCSFDQTLAHSEDKNETANKVCENVENDNGDCEKTKMLQETKGEQVCFILSQKQEVQGNKKDSQKQQIPLVNSINQKSQQITSTNNKHHIDAQQPIKLHNQQKNQYKLQEGNIKNSSNHLHQQTQSPNHPKSLQKVSSQTQIFMISNDPKNQNQAQKFSQQLMKNQEKQLHENLIFKGDQSIENRKTEKVGNEVDFEKQTLVEKNIQKMDEPEIVKSAKFILSDDKNRPTHNQAEIIKQDTLEPKKQKQSQKEIKLQSSIVFVEENNTPQTPQTPRVSKKKVPSCSSIKSNQMKVIEKSQKDTPKKQKQTENKFMMKSRSDKRIQSKIVSQKQIHKDDSESISINILKQNAKENLKKGQNIVQNKMHRGLTSQEKQSSQKQVERQNLVESSKQLLKKGLYVDLVPINSNQTDKIKNVKQNTKKSITETNKTKPQQLALPKKGPLSEPKGSFKSLSKKQSSESDKFSVEKKSLKKIGSNKSIQIKNQQTQETVKYPQIGKTNNQNNKAGQIKKIGYSKFKQSLNRKDINKQNYVSHIVSQKQKANHQKIQADQYESYLTQKEQGQSQKSPKSPFRIVQKSPIKKKNFSSPYLEPVFRKLNIHSSKKGHGRFPKNHELEDHGEKFYDDYETGLNDNFKGLKKQSIAQRNKNMGFNERQVEKLKDEYEKLRNMEEQYARQKRRTKTSSKKKHRKLEYPHKKNDKIESDEEDEEKAKGYKYLKAHSHQFSYLYPSTELNQTGQKLNKRLGELDKKLKRERYSLQRKNKQNGDVHEYIACARKQIQKSHEFLENLD